MNHLSLFNGIGGFQLAAKWVGWKNIAHVEIDSFCNAVVKKHFPKSKCYTDIKEFNGKEYEGTIDIISGGFPCQPFSVAGKRRGKEDDRNLWPEMFRVIQEIHPAWVVGENVANLINFVEFEDALLDLESEGYEVQPFIIPAVSVGAWHRRDRVWIVAYNEKWRRSNISIKKSKGTQFKDRGLRGNVSNTKAKGLERSDTKRTESTERWITKPSERDWWDAEPGVGRVANGIPHRVDRLKSLGNAIVPQVAYQIFKAIDTLDKNL